jgi:hypothetical protein
MTARIDDDHWKAGRSASRARLRSRLARRAFARYSNGER